MLKTMLSALFIGSLFFAGCSKPTSNNTSPVVNQFTINGLHDINFNTSATSNILPVTVLQGTGNQENVTISVEDLPNGILANIDPQAGVPTFGSIITFYEGSVHPAGGAHKIKVVGTSASSRKEYSITINVAMNTFSLAVPDTLDIATYLDLFANVTQSSGNAEPVTLAISGVPSQLSYTQTVTSGTPPFYSEFKFKENTILPAGNYAVNVTATAASGSVTRQTILHAPVWKGFSVDGVQRRAGLTGNFGVDVNLNTLDGTEQVLLGLSGTYWPTADGTYMFNIGGNYSGPQVDVIYQANSLGSGYYKSSPSAFSGQQLTLVNSGGKRRVSVSGVTVYGNSGAPGTKTITIDAAE